ncbi:uncharacterized protein TRAVEDRAFT_60751 [Trametes versicolor FP-101664 SS1]|uniref:uncharacterized protein n=1 Tax=Trametes versicolor (strain FP-101664) TaxID=717944 RepID=UPI000462270F|nr:uncharacterized protein TRAVEDRAFT_60751 [Trametes versicolor FP-101664 SS1]EIW53191.1 hypothetical protein TRAVEDRAFT_60751 [Trametes versicolor FP-101664 SS1]
MYAAVASASSFVPHHCYGSGEPVMARAGLETYTTMVPEGNLNSGAQCGTKWVFVLLLTWEGSVSGEANLRVGHSNVEVLYSVVPE